jgi:hypothetical protein
VHAKHEIDQSQVSPLKASDKIPQKFDQLPKRSLGEQLGRVSILEKYTDYSYPEKRAVFNYFSSIFPSVKLLISSIEDALRQKNDNKFVLRAQ